MKNLFLNFNLNFAPGSKYILFIMLIAAVPTLAKTSESIRYFNSDGCSLSPDQILNRSFVHCCMAHDLKYWKGGTEAEKKQADGALKKCIGTTLGKAYPGIPEIYYWGVQIGGRAIYFDSIKSTLYWRWGYGWDHKANYKSLSEEQKSLVYQELLRLRKGLPDQERALNETNGFAWRFRNLKVSHEQFEYFTKIVDHELINL